MILHTDNLGFEGSLPTNRIAMKIKSSAKMFGILSDGIYKDKILAVVREYVCNAYDAHVTVGKQDVPFTVRLPNYLDSTFAVIDEGTGVDPAMIGEIFWTYGESSKTNDVNTIGALGLGSKSAFAYTKSSFVVKNRYQGTEYTYFCFINENGEPEGSLVGEAVSDEATGITVEFAIRPADCSAFYERFGRIFKYWANVKPNILGAEAKDVFFKDPIKVVEGDKWYLEGTNTHANLPAIAIMGNVTYPIESASIPNLPRSLKIIADNPFIITFPLGDLEFAASRESLSYTEFTCAQIIKRLEEVRSELATSFHEKVFTASKDHVSFYQAFTTTFAEFRKVVHIDAYSGPIEDQFAQLLMSKDHDDDIEFLDTTFSISDLIAGRYKFKIEDFQSFGLYHAGTRGRVTSRYYLEPCTHMSAKLNEEVDSTDFHDGYGRTYKMTVGTTLISDFDWRAKHVSTRTTELSLTDKAILSSKVDFASENRFKINTHKDEVIFIFNDVGSSGRDRFKHIIHSMNKAQLILVDYNAKINKIEDVVVELNGLIDSSLTGATIKYLSDLPDERPVIDKVKVDKESIKLRSFILESKRQINHDISGSYINNVSVNVKMSDLGSSGVKESILLMADLKSKSEVLYIIKRRSNNKYFDDVGSVMEPLSANSTTMNYANHLDMFENAYSDQEYTVRVINDDGTESLEVKTKKVLQILVLNEGQHAHLLKKGVKLISISSMVSTKIKAIEEVEKFTNSIRRFIVLSRVNHLRGMMEGLYMAGNLHLLEGWENETSLYKSLMNEYMQWKVDIQQHALVFVKSALLKAVTKDVYVDYDTESSKITNQLEARYPMIGLIQYNSMYNNKGNKIITYIEQIDLLISDCVKSAIIEMNEVNVEEELV